MSSVVQNVLRALRRLIVNDVHYQDIKGPGALCFVEKVEHGMFFKTYTPICYCNEPTAKRKVEEYNDYRRQQVQRKV